MYSSANLLSFFSNTQNESTSLELEVNWVSFNQLIFNLKYVLTIYTVFQTHAVTPSSPTLNKGQCPNLRLQQWPGQWFLFIKSRPTAGKSLLCFEIGQIIKTGLCHNIFFQKQKQKHQWATQKIIPVFLKKTTCKAVTSAHCCHCIPMEHPVPEGGIWNSDELPRPPTYIWL